MSLSFLIVDDNEDNRTLLMEKLTKDGYSVNVSNIGQEALDLFNELLPNIVLMSFEDVHTASRYTGKMIEIDHTACIFGIVAKVSHEVKDLSFAAGVRALIESDSLLQGKESAEEILNTLGSACSEIKDDQCIKCWETNKFLETLTPIS